VARITLDLDQRARRRPPLLVRGALAVTRRTYGSDLDQVTDEMVDDLRTRFGEDGLVELVYLVALENMRSRFNSSLGLASQGFSSGEACSLAATRRRAVGSA